MTCPSTKLNPAQFDGNWDELRMGQVFSNLLGNAAQHGKQSTPIEVNLTSLQKDINIKITNQGKPIPESKLQNIFDPLVRHDEHDNSVYTKTNLGLGLYIVKEIVLAHNGTLNVLSTEKKGTTFDITLPIN